MRAKRFLLLLLLPVLGSSTLASRAFAAGPPAPAPAAAPVPALSPLQQAEGWYDGSAGRIDPAKARPLFERAAATGDPIAAVRIATLYHLGAGGFPKDRARAAALAAPALPAVRRLAAAGDPAAQFALGSALLLGVGIPADPAAARPWYVQAGGKGHRMALHNLAWMYDSGTGVAADPVRAFAGYRRAAEAGNAISMLDLAKAYFAGDGTKADVPEGYHWALRGAERGNAKCMGLMGRGLLAGVDMPRNAAEGLAWTRQAVALGEPWAVQNLTGWFEDERLPLAEREASYRWFLAEAGRGNTDAMAAVAFLPGFEDSLHPDPAHCIGWAQRAADAGSPLGMRLVGSAYRRGWGVKQDRALAVSWWQRATAAGDVVSTYWLAQNYIDGEVIPADRRQGLALLMSAADAGLIYAQVDLAHIYEDGSYGVARDRATARKYYQLAAEQGDKEAIGWLKYDGLRAQH